MFNSRNLAKVSSALALVLGVSGASVAHAAPYLSISLLGSVHGSGDPFASQVFVKTGDVVDYEVRFQLAVQGSSNLYLAADPVLGTITRWVPSNANINPTAGLNSIRFNLNQSAASGTIQTDFSSGVTGTTTGGSTWGLGLGSQNGAPVDRGNGFHDMKGAFLMREAGNFDGIANDLSPEIITAATGSFAIGASGTTTTLNINYNGLARADAVAGFRWRNAANTSNVVWLESIDAYNKSSALGDPVTVFQDLTISPAGITPEPATFGLAAIMVPALLGRRSRRRSSPA